MRFHVNIKKNAPEQDQKIWITNGREFTRMASVTSDIWFPLRTIVLLFGSTTEPKERKRSLPLPAVVAVTSLRPLPSAWQAKQTKKNVMAKNSYLLTEGIEATHFKPSFPLFPLCENSRLKRIFDAESAPSKTSALSAPLR